MLLLRQIYLGTLVKQIIETSRDRIHFQWEPRTTTNKETKVVHRDPLPAVLVCAHVRPCSGLNYSLLFTQKSWLLATLAFLRKKRTQYLVEILVLTVTSYSSARRGRTFLQFLRNGFESFWLSSFRFLKSECLVITLQFFEETSWMRENRWWITLWGVEVWVTSF